MSFAVARLALPALLAFAVSPAGAATPEVEAARYLAREHAFYLKELRALLKVETVEAFAAIRSAELALVSGVGASAAADALFAALADIQRDVKAGIESAADQQALVANDALGIMGVANPGVYPEAFYPVGRTSSALFQESVVRDVARAYAKIAKRLDKLVARFEAEGSSFAYVIRPPRDYPAWIWSELESTRGQDFAPTLDLALMWGDLSVAGSVSLRVAGSSSADFVTVTGVTASGSATTLMAGPIAPLEERFATATDSLDEGLWRIATSAPETPYLVIGVR
jgi:hypothetical protein